MLHYSLIPAREHNMAIPIIDLGDLSLANKGEVSTTTITRVAKEVYEAFTTTGFVYLKNHGVDRTQVDDIHDAAGKFFALPADVKRRYQNDGPRFNHGYTIPDQERLQESSTRELRESFNISFLDGLFPEEVPELQPASVALAKQLEILAKRFLRVIAVALAKEEDFFLEYHDNLFSKTNRSCMRILLYPPIAESDAHEGVTRLGAHSDFGTFTFLIQDDVGGLEVKTTSGQWIEAVPIPGTMLVNVGDMLQFWSGGLFKSTEHRVRLQMDRKLQQKSRRSLAYFVLANEATMVRPLTGTAGNEECINAGEYLFKRFSETYVY